MLFKFTFQLSVTQANNSCQAISIHQAFAHFDNIQRHSDARILLAILKPLDPRTSSIPAQPLTNSLVEQEKNCVLEKINISPRFCSIHFREGLQTFTSDFPPVRVWLGAQQGTA